MGPYEPLAGAEEPREQPPTPEQLEAAMLETTYGTPETFQAIYRVDPIAGGKRFQGTWLETDDGRLFVLTYRPDPDRFAFIDKRVTVTGRRAFQGAATQHIMVDHFAVDTITLASGETPYATTPTEIPAPPTVVDAAGLQLREGQWCRLVGIVVSVSDKEHGPDDVVLRLADGTTLSREVYQREQWAGGVGAKVTVVTKVSRAVPADAPPTRDGAPAIAPVKTREPDVRWHMIGPAELCIGDITRCGMMWGHPHPSPAARCPLPVPRPGHVGDPSRPAVVHCPFCDPVTISNESVVQVWSCSQVSTFGENCGYVPPGTKSPGTSKSPTMMTTPSIPAVSGGGGHFSDIHTRVRAAVRPRVRAVRVDVGAGVRLWHVEVCLDVRHPLSSVRIRVVHTLVSVLAHVNHSRVDVEARVSRRCVCGATSATTGDQQHDS